MRFVQLVAVFAALALAGCTSSSGSLEGARDLGGFAGDTGSGRSLFDARPGSYDVEGGKKDTEEPPLPGMMGSACEGHDDCGEDGWCVEGPDGFVCTITCVDNCPADWSCAGVGGLGGDLLFVCLPAPGAVCTGCSTDADCEGTPKCVLDPGGAAGDGACLAPCGGPMARCPEGFECRQIRRKTGAEEIWVCAPLAGLPCCGADAEGATAACTVTNEHGTCTGQRTCRGPVGWSPCSAAEPAEEVCNAMDDDCDGEADNGLGPLCACGDGECSWRGGESAQLCPCDCHACGDGVCSPCGESPTTCPGDCCRSHEGTSGCGDGYCLGYGCGENPGTCAADCGTACGNRECERGEDPSTCAEDCKHKVCGNRVCEGGEGPEACPQDCAAFCGDCVCDPGRGESLFTCPVDCGFCGDLVCSVCATLQEDASTCSADCCVPRDEVCNGNDDDCDGEVDEGTCDDRNPCTEDRCDGQRDACVFEPLSGTPCDDGLACTHSDRCDAGSCEGVFIPSCCSSDDGCYNDDDPCNGVTRCDDGDPDPVKWRCRIDPDSVPSCDDGEPCTKDTMEPGTCACGHSPITDFAGGDGCCPAGATSATDMDCGAECGNGVKDGDELCDTAAQPGHDDACPSSCGDGDPCTIDGIVGSGCYQRCTHEIIDLPVEDDGCCPDGAHAGSDSDCEAVCGNGVLEPGERCDTGIAGGTGSCPASCEDGDPCTRDFGPGSGCQAACDHEEITSPAGGDGCCPTGANSGNDSDCEAYCGNGVVDSGEVCDVAIAGGSGACPTDCEDGDPCTLDARVGVGCTVRCESRPVTTPSSGDGCCPDGANASNDSDCEPVCGNAVKERGETCDGDCPQTCDDDNACTVDNRTGSTRNCDVECSYEPVSECRSYDSCCPPDCNANSDSDCSTNCGNEVKEAGETCDGDCPESCDDYDPCTRDTRTGSAGNCNVVCTHANVTECSAGDSCCPEGCNANTDSDCRAKCGNGIVEPGEICDGDCPVSCADGDACTEDTLTGTPGSCDVECAHEDISVCSGGDGCCPPPCTANNDSDCGAMCGNGIVEPGELCDVYIISGEGACPQTCDDGVACTKDVMEGEGCLVSCTSTPIVEPANDDGCCLPGSNAATDNDCEAVCGNGAVEPGESCDPGIASGEGSCPSSCNDGEPCTRDTMSGAGCQKKCNHETITERRGGDGCCPEGATNDEDSDCLPTCGNGVVDEGEYCDIGITVTQTGICPTSCHDGNPCTEDILEGSGCQRRCEYPAIVDAVANDGCCPPGHTVVTDGDCPALLFDGTPRTICDRGYQWHVPTVAAGPDRYAVGCLPKGSQNTTPYLYFTDGLGITLSTQTLLTSDGYYYKDNQLSFHDNRFQVVYEYNCDDAGNWRVGWGWGCVDFREYDTSGSLLANPPAFGERGHNGHPVLDWSGTEFGVAWVSYDDFYFRRIDSDRQLIGEDPYENIYIGKDPDQSDARSGARTKIAWDLENGGYGIFVIIGGEIYFQRISIDGTVLVSTRSLGAGYSQTFGGQFVALYHAGAYSLVYPDGEKLLFKRIGLDGSIQASVTVAGHNVRQPHMFRKGDHFYVTYNEADGHARVKVYDTSATAVPGKSGPIGDGRTMTAPVSTYDPTYGRIAIVYLDANQKVVFQRLKESN